jgi:hypothetical protein
MPKRFSIGTNLGLSSRSITKRRGKNQNRKAQPIQRACLDALETRTLMSTYFVSTSGADNAAGTLAQPFRTIQAAANAAYSGDTVEIEGGAYHETVTPPHGGVTFTNYNNQAVTISGADAVSGFSNYSGSIYATSLSSSLGEGNNQVFVDGQVLNEARWPNTSLNPSSPTKATIGSYSNSTIYDSSLTQGNGYWVGADINITPGDGWTTYTGSVTASGPGWITVALPATDAYEQPAAGNSYFLYGKFQALNTAGEFYVDSSNKLYLWDQYGDNPNYHDVEVKDRLYGFDLSNVANTTIQGINLFACTINTGWNSTGTTINDINASYISQFMVVQNGWVPPSPAGIQLYGSNSILENSTIAYSAGDGVFIDNNSITVKNNTIHDVDYSGTDSASIRAYGSNITIADNTIYNTGRDGINFRGSGYSILYNTIHDCMLQTADGGGIYTVSDNGGGSVIAYNAVYNINVVSGYDGAGIYLDNDSSNFIIHDNTTANVQAGLKLNFTSYNETIYNNRLGASVNAIETNGWTGFAYDWSGSQVYDNTYYNPRVMLGANAAQWGNTYASGSPAIPASYTTTVTLPPPPAPASPPPPPPAAVITTTTPPPPPATVITTTTPAPTTPAPTTPAPTTPAPTTTTTSSSSSSSTASAGPAYPANAVWTATLDATQSNVAPSYGAVGWTNNGSWVGYQSINFGSGALTTFHANLAVTAPYAGQKIEVFIDSLNTTPVAILTTVSTGAWNTFQWETAGMLSTVTGVHTVYIEFVGAYGVANLLNWQFS